MNSFELIPFDWQITFGEWAMIKTGPEQGNYKVVNERTIIIEDCYFGKQAENKFWELVDYDYDNYIVIDIEEVEWTTRDDVVKMERDAVLNHLFEDEHFGLTDDAIVGLYYEYDE